MINQSIVTGKTPMNNSTRLYKNRLFWITVLLLLPILLQIFYTGLSFFDFENHKWIAYKANRIILFIFWSFITIGIVSLLKLRLTYLAIPLLISLVVSAYSIVTHENIEYEVFAAISNTSYNEAIELFSSYFFLVPLSVLLVIFAIIYFRLLKPQNKDNVSFYSTRKSAILMIVLGIIGLNLLYMYSRDTLYKTYPLSIPFYLKGYYKEIVLFKKEFNKINYSFQGVNENKNTGDLCILMIGETARKQSMSVYGYHRDTTPNIQKAINSEEIKAAIYDTVSSGVSTRLSVPLLLSTTNTNEYSSLSKSPTLPHIFNDVGFQTKLLSNQETAGRNNDIIALILNNMSELTYLSESDETRGYDVDLIPKIKEAALENSNSMFMVVHLMGSHWKYEQRYPNDFSSFSGGDYRVDTYDNSIRYTDHIIGQVLDIMAQSERPICLLYTSDHGENLNDLGDRNYLHAIKEMTEYEIKVPLFFAANSSFYNVHTTKVDSMLGHKNKLVSHDNISHTILGLSGIYDENYYKKQYDLSSSEFHQSKRYSINRRGEIVDVDEYLTKR